MHYLILGANGQLGSEWHRYLDHHGRSYNAITSSDVDIRKTMKLRNTLRDVSPDLVINCAAYTDVDGAEEDFKEAFQVNAEAVGKLAEICNELDTKLVHYSTDYVFPGTLSDKEKFPNGYTEDTDTDPVNAYGRTKEAGEKNIQSTPVNHLIIRASWLCGQHGSNFLKTMINLARERSRLQVVNDQWASPTFAGNLIDNTEALLKNDVEGIVHVTSDGLCTWYDFALKIMEAAEIDIEIEPVTSDQFPRKAKRPAFSKLNIQKLKTVEDAEVLKWQEGTHQLISELI